MFKTARRVIPEAVSGRNLERNAAMSHYSVLAVAPDASAEEIRKAHRALALRWHPDKAE